MNLQPIFPAEPAFPFTCLKCHTRHLSTEPGAMADLDGAPFQAYYCGDCAPCQWCGQKSGCDCEERAACPNAGKIGHMDCGRQPCGCPRFVTCDHAPAASKGDAQ